jgi:outer membrane usher protein
MLRGGGALLLFPLGSVLLAGQAMAGELPAMATSAALAGPVVLYLELVVNGASIGKVVPVTLDGGRHFMRAGDLAIQGARLGVDDREDVALDRIEGLTYEYDQAGQRLLLTVPDSWLAATAIDLSGDRHRIAAEADDGAALSYDLYFTGAGRDGARASLWSEARVFGDWGVLRGNGVAETRLGGTRGASGYRRYDTTWSLTDAERMLVYEAGDLVTRTLSWGAPVRLGGIQLSRDFGVRPDVVTYPLPRFSGVADLPTTLDLFVAGHKMANAELAPGPFTLDMVPYVNGAGEAVLVTTDSLGRQTSVTMPFYVATPLLRPGLSDFSLATGFLRRDYGRRSFAYGQAAAAAAYRRGITDSLTLELRAETARGIASGGAGSVVRLGRWGVADVAVGASRYEGRSGTQWSGGYQYSSRAMNFSLRHLRASARYAGLADLDRGQRIATRRQTQAMAGFALSDFGTLGLSYIDAQYEHDRTRLASLNWTRALPGGLTISFGASKTIGNRQASGFLQLTMPLGRGAGLAGASAERGRPIRPRLQYALAEPLDGGFGFSAGVEGHGASLGAWQADTSWRGASFRLAAGAYGNGSRATPWGSLSGSVAFMDGRLFAANRLGDGFALVTTGGVAGVPVLYENQQVGRTNDSGYLLVPSVPAYYGGKYEVDVGHLPAEIEADMVERRAAVVASSGRIVRFPMRQVRRVDLKLVDAAGAPLAAGLTVEPEQGTPTIVGLDGFAHLEAHAGVNRLRVRLDGGESCAAMFDADARPGDRVTCR